MSVCPARLKPFCLALPSTWVMEGMRDMVLAGAFDWKSFWIGFGLNLLCTGAFALFCARMLDRGGDNGQLVRIAGQLGGLSMKRNGFMIALLTLAGSASAAIRTQTVEYMDGKTALQGTLVYDDARSGKAPGILVVHEWKGLGDYAKGRADQLAKLGHVAFALDMYGKGVYAKDHEEAGRLSGVFFNDRDLMRRRALAGLEILKNDPHVDASRLAAIGYCFGGTTVLELARAGTDLKGVVSFHGNLASPNPADAATLKAKILVLQGADDAWTAGGIPGFQEEMKKAKADYQIVSCGGAVHSFTVKEAGDDPSKGMAYAAAADRRSWRALMEFFKELGIQ